MKLEAIQERENNIAHTLSRIPRKMVSLHGNYDNIAEFVLHELCSPYCLNITKAAYFIDNPDFDCFKGVAGVQYDQNGSACDIWCYPDDFSSQMRTSIFNTKVRNFHRPSLRRTVGSDAKIVQEIASDLDLSNHRSISFDGKHDNHGLFVFELAERDSDYSPDLILDGLSFLVFCPVHF